MNGPQHAEKALFLIDSSSLCAGAPSEAHEFLLEAIAHSILALTAATIDAMPTEPEPANVEDWNAVFRKARKTADTREAPC